MEYTIKKYEEQEKAKPQQAVQAPSERTKPARTVTNTAADAS